MILMIFAFIFAPIAKEKFHYPWNSILWLSKKGRKKY